MRVSLLLAFAGLLFAALPAQAQPNSKAAPKAGTLTAAAEPASMSIQAGGPDRNGVPGSGCSGFITNDAPTAVVQAEGGGPLAIYATSDIDTTILIADPAGRWHCSDDANGSNPGVSFARADAGPYAVWVGTFSPEAAGAAAQLSAVRGEPRW
ncbi:hypothetical protein RQM47_04065 [Rubrivirga sp. S365]|uniref:Uncharacterized protein n=1 Tax=Rubrivirga litoralis TaxID=3075598 RepID=A0ABU3BM10_9BACT|nr:MULTISPECIES: hypothetical protein [unclassified Rubrivirga]MDT0630298.1 hypothetical protein [Rubrivirga sp. F394]MDT7855810.1 hypothetical protein [Rubrivirga sp. S365]